MDDGNPFFAVAAELADAMLASTEVRRWKRQGESSWDYEHIPQSMVDDADRRLAACLESLASLVGGSSCEQTARAGTRAVNLP